MNSVLMVRQHRGNRLVNTGEGGVNAQFTCSYHN